MNVNDRWTCPLDAPHETVPRPLGDLELHMGLKHDDKHIAWRIKHGLPAEINLRTINKYRKVIRFAIMKDAELFKKG